MSSHFAVFRCVNSLLQADLSLIYTTDYKTTNYLIIHVMNETIPAADNFFVWYYCNTKNTGKCYDILQFIVYFYFFNMSPKKTWNLTLLNSEERQGTPLDETLAHRRALSEHLGIQYLAQGYLSSVLAPLLLPARLSNFWSAFRA